MAYTYPFPRGWATFNRKMLLEDLISSSLSEVGTGATPTYAIDTDIDPIQVWKRIIVPTSYRGKGQQYGLVAQELGGAASAAHTAALNTEIRFCAFPRTLDDATGLERPYAEVPFMTYLMDAAAGQSLRLTHTTFFPGPNGIKGGSVLADWDPVAKEYFTAQLEGLLTSIVFGWRYWATADAVITGAAVARNIELITHSDDVSGP